MPRLANCPDIKTLQRFVSGRISEKEAEPLESHLSECRRCSESIESLPVDDDLVRDMRRRSPLLCAEGEQPVELIARLQQLWTTISSNVARLSEEVNRDTDSGNGESTATHKPKIRNYDFLEPPQHEDELGRLGPYRVGRVLGYGGMGVVFQAQDERLGRDVALKVLLDARYTDPHYVSRFEREAEALSRLQHPHIVRVYEAGQHRGRPYLALEYVSGGTLAEKLAGRPSSIVESATLMETVARAVHYAHTQGILHRDLKPGNILLSASDQHPLVADFGLAKRADVVELTQTGDVLGTPGYIAPELAGGGKESTAAVDTYSLGAILYELLIGRPPFRGETSFETLALARSTDPVPVRRLRPAVPRDLETICLKCLEREPHKRYATAEELADDLARFLRSEPIRARPTSMLERLVKWARRKPALALLISVTSLSLVLFVALNVIYSERVRSTLVQVERERSRADEGYQSARDTLNRMLTRLERRSVGDAPQLKELQRELLEDALAFYLDILKKDDRHDPAVQRDCAVACQRAATIESLLGKWDDAEKHFQLCLKLLDALPSELREDPANQALLAACHNNIAHVANNNHRWDEAEQNHRAALEIQERLARLQPDEAAHRSGIAQTALNLGAVYQLTGRLSDAEPCLVRASEMHAALVEQFPNDENYRSSLAQDHENLALLYQNTGREELAIQGHDKADKTLRPLVNQHPPGGDHALTLAAVCINWSFCLRAASKPEEALAKTSEAVELVERILRKEPQHYVARTRAYRAHGARAQIYDSLGQHAEAAADWERAVELDTEPDPWLRRLYLAGSLVRSNQTAKAVAAAAVLAADPNVFADGQYAVACVYALSIASSNRDEKLSATERAAISDRCATQAMSLLRKLQEQGYFKDASHADSLQKDEDLRSLRDRADFQELLKK